MPKPNKTKVKELTKFLKAKAKEYKSDWEDVPLWVIDACVEFNDLSKQTTKQKTIAYAEQFLAGNGKTEDAIKAIIKHEDENDLIDFVEGVDVWEKVEFSFTCKQFLQEINYIPSDWK